MSQYRHDATVQTASSSSLNVALAAAASVSIAIMAEAAFEVALGRFEAAAEDEVEEEKDEPPPEELPVSPSCSSAGFSSEMMRMDCKHEAFELWQLRATLKGFFFRALLIDASEWNVLDNRQRPD